MHVFTCSVMSDFAIPWTDAHQAPLSMGLSREEYWSGLPFPLPGDLPTPGIKCISCISCIGRQTLYHLSCLGSPHPKYTTVKNLYTPNMSPGLYKIKCVSPLYFPHLISVTCLMSTNLIDCIHGNI